MYPYAACVCVLLTGMAKVKPAMTMVDSAVITSSIAFMFRLNGGRSAIGPGEEGVGVGVGVAGKACVKMARSGRDTQDSRTRRVVSR